MARLHEGGSGNSTAGVPAGETEPRLPHTRALLTAACSHSSRHSRWLAAQVPGVVFLPLPALVIVASSYDDGVAVIVDHAETRVVVVQDSKPQLATLQGREEVHVCVVCV